MPDWSYQTLIRPALFQLPPERARAITLGALRLLGQIPFGIQLIALMGHMQPPADLSRMHAGLKLASPVGLGADLPGNEHALQALSHFGIGFIELGPVATAAHTGEVSIVRQIEAETLQIRPAIARSVDQLVDVLQHTGPLPTALAVRLGHAPGADAPSATTERVTMIEKLVPFVQFLTLTPPPSSWSRDAWCAHLSSVLQAAQQCPLLVGVSIDATDDQLRQIIEPALAQGAAGVLICNGITGPEGTRLLGAPARAAVGGVVRRVRLLTGSEATLLIAGGAHSPADSLVQLEAGADLVALDSGLVFGGPGLPKRTNEAIRALDHGLPTPRPFSAHSAMALLGAGWLWMLLLGLSMILGGILAWGIAATTVVLPYDLEFVGLEQSQMAALNPRLLHFMAHDRVSLAGTMIAIGVLYCQIAWHGLRRREHWAKRAIVVSAATGFVSFFLFLGYGYFDPLHAAVSFALLPLFVLGAWAAANEPPVVPVPDLHNDTAWKLANWGQLGAVSLGIGLAAAGAGIAFVGVTTVFVPEDLRYLGTTAPVLDQANAKLVSLIAHDRAGFGGALVSNGLGVLLLSLWGIRRGARWVWWTLLLAGLPGFIGALGVHLTVGYLDLWHLFPGLLALLLFGATLVLLYPYLCGAQPAGGWWENEYH